MNTFLGYWGQGEPADIDTQLGKVLALVPSTPSHLKHSFANSALLTGVVCWGKHIRAHCKDDGLTVALAASGLREDQDVSVVAQPNSLKLHRDAMGRVPLYWMQQKGVFWFASHLRLLVPLLENKAIATTGLYGYACFSYCPTPFTPLKSVFAVSAGTTGTVQRRPGTQANLEVYWARQDDEWQEPLRPHRIEHKASAQLQQLLTKAMQKQLSDYPSGTVGVFLSGGLDSAITAALLVRAGAKVQAYTLDFGSYGVSEVQYAERVAQYLDIPLRKVEASPTRVRDALLATARALDMPCGDGATVPLYLLNQAARKDCTVVFNGEGGDQLFGGWTNKPLIAADVYQPAHPAGTDFAEEYLRTFHRLHGHEAEVFSAAVRAEIPTLNPQNWLSDALDNMFTPTLLHRLRRANLMLKGAQNIQPRASNLSLAFDLAVRTPFCDRELASWTFQVANDLFLRESHEKYLLKRAVEVWLPPDIVWREKRGMGVPLTQWCLGPLWRTVGEWLQPSVLRGEGLWQEDLALRLATGKLSGQLQGRRIGESLWLLLMWQVWRKVILQDEFKRESLQPFLLPPKFWQWRMNRT
ncbi:MAG TPA: asparagine synthetase B family protein [Blastocatellia bacterium]|nr:asparagine synthetase B family protein [Blastocatellia bacterium]